MQKNLLILNTSQLLLNGLDNNIVTTVDRDSDWDTTGHVFLSGRTVCEVDVISVNVLTVHYS